MKVALFHPHFDAPRGAEKIVLVHAHALAKLGWDVRLLCFDWKPEAFSAADRALDPQFLPAPRRHWDGRPDRATSNALAAALAGCDVAVAHNYPASAYLGHAPTSVRRLWYCEEPFRALYVPETRPALHRAYVEGRLDPAAPITSYYRRALRNSSWNLALNPRYRGKRRADRAGISALDGVAANSAATAAIVRTIFDRDAAVMHCPVDFPERLPPPPPAETPLRILTMGGFAPLKGLALLLAGFERFLATTQQPVVLEVVGAGSERASIERLVAGSRVAASMRIHGWISQAELEALRAQCHAFAAMPADEPFGLVFGEAIAAGLIAIGPDNGGPAEILAHGESGIVADPFDASSVAAALSRFAGLDRMARDRLREAAFASAKPRFDSALLPARLHAWLAR
jgi:glycosyltransferase involved in cell wall biosynthesis